MNYYLDQLITKKIPSKRNPIIIGIKQKSDNKEHIDDDDNHFDKDDEKANVEIIVDSDDIDETEKKQTQLQILDKRETSNINRQLIFNRFKKKNFLLMMINYLNNLIVILIMMITSILKTII